MRSPIAADPTNTGWLRDLSISHNKLGDLATATGDIATAKQHHHTSLEIRKRLAAADPASSEWQRDLSTSHQEPSDVTAIGDLIGTAPHNPREPQNSSRGQTPI
jgi:hypothetical protein